MGLFSHLRSLLGLSPRLIPTKFLIVGLGNPGDEYTRTRHNIGYRVVDALDEKFASKSKGSEFQALYKQGSVESGQEITTVKPLTYMNRSGIALKAYMEQLKVPISSVLVIVDDFNIPLGTIRLRNGGSHGGHNGLKSIISEIGDGFPRLRIGIGPLPSGISVIDFVLGHFSDEEEQRLGEINARAVNAIYEFLRSGIDIAMSKHNA